MSNPNNLPPPLPLPPPPQPLYKHNSWSPDIYREDAWLRRKGDHHHRQTHSLTDDDLDELKACIELGFGFDSLHDNPRLSDTLPALGLYYAVNKQYNSSSSTPSECETLSPLGSPHTICSPGENPQTVKTRLRHWAQVVACSVRQLKG